MKRHMKRFISSVIILVILTGSAYADRLAIPSGSLPWSTLRDTYLNVMTEELYTYLGATEGALPSTPTFDGMIISGAGNSWIQVYNNTEWTDTLTGLGGFGILDWHPYTILNGTPARLALYSEVGSFAFDTYPTYEDSAHSSGIAVNGTTLAVYSETASKWLTVGLTDTLDPTPVMYTLTITDPGNGDVISSTDTFIDCGDGATDCTHDYASGATPELTATPAAGREFTEWTGDATDTSTTTNPDTITMVSAKSVGASFAVDAGTTPDVLYECEDNAASTTVLATYGSNGSLIDVNTADNTSTTNCGGTRSFSPIASTTRIVSGALTEASLDDGTFTIQFDYYADASTGFGAGNYVRLVKESNTGSAIMFRSNNGSSTSFLLQIGGSEYTITLDEINTGACQTIRIVVDAAGTNKVVVYQGANEAGLVAKYTRTDSITTPDFPTTPTITFGASGDANQGIQLRNGKMDDIKIWYGVVTP